MPIEFREVRRGEIDDALAFAAAAGAEIDRAQMRSHLSLVARNRNQVILGSALHWRDEHCRHHIAVHLNEDTHPGLARLLLDRALGKARAAGIATTHLNIHSPEAEAVAWESADWLATLTPKPAAQPADTASQDGATPNKPADGKSPTNEAATAQTNDAPASTPDEPPAAPGTAEAA